MLRVFYFSKSKVFLAALALVLMGVISIFALLRPLSGSLPRFTDYTRSIRTAGMMQHVRWLSASDNARVTGQDGERLAADYIEYVFGRMGYKAQRQHFPMTLYSSEGAEARITGQGPKNLPARELSFSAPTVPGGLRAPVADCGAGTRSVYEGMDIKGKIVLIERGGEYFFVKTDAAADAGAAAVIFFDPGNDEILEATLVKPSKIPALCISRHDAAYIRSLLAEGLPVEAEITVRSSIVKGASENIFAQYPAENRKNSTKTLVIGAHYDGVDTPAANDNASGISVLLETARLLAGEKLGCNVVFAAFGAEEVGLVGSQSYMAALSMTEQEKIIGMINLDMVGVGSKIRVNTLKRDSISFMADLVQKCADRFGYPNERSFSDRSDHEVFERNGIPVAFIECAPYGNYHTDGDTADKIEPGNLAKVCNVVAAVIKEVSLHPDKYCKTK